VRAERGFDFHLSTIEEAKGKEYEHVALPFMEPGRFPASAPHALAFLERNRLYVAMTRARKRLWLLEHAERRVQPFA
ncbi:ATP-binding domain-containing protein, partial [Delftia acidovorans]